MSRRVQEGPVGSMRVKLHSLWLLFSQISHAFIFLAFEHILTKFNTSSSMQLSQVLNLSTVQSGRVWEAPGEGRILEGYESPEGSL